MHMATARAKIPRKPRPFRWTSALLERMPRDGNRYEALDGELLVTPQAGPPHQVIAAKLVTAFSLYFDAHPRGMVVGPGAVMFGKNELQPDVQLIPAIDQKLPATKWKDLPLPLLVVEILSHGSHRHDLHKKRDAYLRLGIPEYWVVDPEERCVRVFRAAFAPGEPTRVTDLLSWKPWVDVPALEINVSKLIPR